MRAKMLRTEITGTALMGLEPESPWGKILGPGSAMKSGVGSYAVEIGPVRIGAVVAVNAFGTIYEGEKPLAGPHRDGEILSTEDFMVQGMEASFKGNTTIGCILTNATLTKSQANKLASMSHDGYARAIRPVHTMVDGDTIFVMASGKEQADFNLLSTLSLHGHGKGPFIWR